MINKNSGRKDSKDLVNGYVASRIRQIRIEKDVRVAEAARRSGIAIGSYSCLETGRFRISLDHLFRIQAALDFKIAEVWPDRPRLSNGPADHDLVARCA